MHGWIPYTEDCKTIVDWRFNATEEDWNRAVWSKTPDLVKNKVWDDREYTIVCGHWYCSYGNYYYGEAETEFSDFNPFISNGIIAIDACTAYSGKVNCIVLED